MRLPVPSLVATALALVAPSAADGRAQPTDNATAEALIDDLGRDAAHQAIVAEPLARARLAIERAMRFRALGDEVHARAADGLAREWAETSRDIARAADAEAKAADVRRRALEEQTQLERTRALIDEGIARIGRLKAELDEAQHTAATDAKPGAKSDRRAVEVHDGEADAGPATKTAPPASAAVGSAP
jgi:hypothetical protein